MSKIKLYLIMPLILSLILSPTETRATNPITEDMVFKVGSVAPYDGVLVPEANYRIYNDCMDIKSVLEKKCDAEAPPTEDGFKIFYYSFTAGVVLGALAVLLLKH